jgi:ABC-type transport system substrate-binding protein
MVWEQPREGKRMKGHRRSTGMMVTLLGILLLMPIWGLAQQPKSGGTLRVAWEADLTGIDPHVSAGLQAYRVVGNIFNSLLTTDAALNFVPDLAESWEILEDSKVYVFHLRKGVKFHDGTDFDAEVVRWNYQRIIDPDEKALDAPFYSIVEAVEAIDAHTVKFILKHPSRTPLPVMAAYRVGFAQMSPAAYKRWGKEEVRLHPVGTGPFTLARLIDTRAGNNTSNHQDKHVDALIDRLREAATEEAYLQAGYDLQRYVTENMLYQSVTSLPFTQAARTFVKGYGAFYAYNRFETTWLDK